MTGSIRPREIFEVDLRSKRAIACSPELHLRAIIAPLHLGDLTVGGVADHTRQVVTPVTMADTIRLDTPAGQAALETLHQTNVGDVRRLFPLSHETNLTWVCTKAADGEWAFEGRFYEVPIAIMTITLTEHTLVVTMNDPV